MISVKRRKVMFLIDQLTQVVVVLMENFPLWLCCSRHLMWMIKFVKYRKKVQKLKQEV